MFNRIELFKKRSFEKKIQLSVFALILGIMVLAPMVSAAENPNHYVVPVDSKFLGNTYGGWSADWWKWVVSIPADRNPLSATGNFNAAIGQSGDVWFLAGTLGGPTVNRNCKIPAGKALFFPIINAEGSKVEGNGKTPEELRAYAKGLIDHVTVREVTVDGHPLIHLDKFRVESKPFVFKLPLKNILVSPDGSTAPAGPSLAMSDGYWIMLKPLSEGDHYIHIRGVAVFDDDPKNIFTFETDVTYHLIIVKPERY